LKAEKRKEAVFVRSHRAMIHRINSNYTQYV
jgi:hypothetical protein